MDYLDALFTMDYLQLVSAVAIVSTISLFSTGILTCHKIRQTKSVGSVPHIPFVAAAVNCALWLTYGLLKPDGTVTVVNVVGLIEQIAYIVVYITYADNKPRVQRDVTVAMVIVVPVVAYYTCIATGESRLVQLGVICNFFTILFFASPLTTMAEVVRNQDTESMSLPLSAMAAMTSASWTVYGFMVQDVYIQLPNAVGLMLSLIQLALFVKYGISKKKTIISMETPMV